MADLRTLLFDPAAARALVLARRPAVRPAGRAVVADVVSDRVWTDVVALLRWASAATSADPALRPGARRRLAAACADLVGRLPGLADEVSERWDAVGASTGEAAGAGADRVTTAADRLASALFAAEPPDLHTVTELVHALGAAAVAAPAEAARPGPAARPR